MKIIQAYLNFIDKLNKKIGYYTSWLTFILVLIVCYDVFTRYLLRESSTAIQELEWHIFALIFLMAAAYTFKTNDHVRVDVFYVQLSEKKKALVNLLGTILFLIPLCIVVIISSKGFVLQSWITKETSPDAGGLPARDTLKSIIPISFFILLLEAIAFSIKSFFVLKDNNEINNKKEE